MSTEANNNNLILDNSQIIYVVTLNGDIMCYLENREDAVNAVREYGKNELNVLRTIKAEDSTDIQVSDEEGSYTIVYRDLGWVYNGSVERIHVAYKKVPFCLVNSSTTPPNERVTVTIDVSGQSNHRALLIRELHAALEKRRNAMKPDDL